MPKISILLVEDEKKIAEILSKGLSEHNYNVDIANDGLTGRDLFNSNHYDLILLDINLPYMNGYELCRYIRKQDDKILILMLTALNSMDDKLEGFNTGADDYLIKPFNFKELLVRIHALLKRVHSHPSATSLLTVADLVVNMDSKEVTRDGKDIVLTAKEFQLLEYFIRNKNKVISRADIALDVWDIDFDTKTNVIDVYVNFLRKKLDRDFSIKLLHTYVGLGYILKENG
jgi:two-component system copper resistance phosphate regulon response regulator CusR